jgi:cytidyltransferase-like protein
MTLVLCCGVFDLFHLAHLRHLQEARAMGDYLVVGVTTDAGVGKKGRPIVPQAERLEIVQAVRWVSAAALHENSISALEQWKPQIFVKGHDYIAGIKKGLLKAEVDYCIKHDIRIAHTKPNPQTTTKIIERIRCASA